MILKELYTKNYHILGNQHIELHKGMTVVTGETGAGKSLLVNAIHELFGGKIVWERHKSNEEITGIVELSGEEHIIKRSIFTKERKSRFFIDDSPVTRARVIEKFWKYIEITSQYESQDLLNPQIHYHYFDILASLEKLEKEVEESYKNYHNALLKLKQAEHEYSERQKQREFLNYQLKEMKSLNVQPDEDITLAEKLSIFESIENLGEMIDEGKTVFYEGENSIYSLVSEFRNKYERLYSKEISRDGIGELIEGIGINAEEVWKILERYSQMTAVSKDEIEAVRERLYNIKTLFRKYNISSTQELKELIKRTEAAIDNMNVKEMELGKLREDLRHKQDKLSKLCRSLKFERKGSKAKIEKYVEKELSELGITRAKFLADIRDKEDGPTGSEDIEFLISTVPGEPPAKLRFTASGGELSRILLAFKKLLKAKDIKKIVIFDEIDTGIGGNVAGKVGAALQQISKQSEMIVITHLPQIAAFADWHIFVKKNITGDTTEIQIKYLNKEERINEIARMISGGKITQSAITHAASLIKRR